MRLAATHTRDHQNAVGAGLLDKDVTDPDLDQQLGIKILAWGCIIFLTVLNGVGVEWGMLIQNLFTVIKLLLLSGMLLAGLNVLGSEGSGTLATNFESNDDVSTSWAGYTRSPTTALPSSQSACETNIAAVVVQDRHSDDCGVVGIRRVELGQLCHRSNNLTQLPLADSQPLRRN